MARSPPKNVSSREAEDMAMTQKDHSEENPQPTTRPVQAQRRTTSMKGKKGAQ
jgi:hypothetical protein